MTLQELRQLRGFKQEDVAKQLGVKQSTVSKWETSDDGIKIKNLERYVQSLGGKLIVEVRFELDRIKQDSTNFILVL